MSDTNPIEGKVPVIDEVKPSSVVETNTNIEPNISIEVPPAPAVTPTPPLVVETPAAIEEKIEIPTEEQIKVEKTISEEKADPALVDPKTIVEEGHQIVDHAKKAEILYNNFPGASKAIDELNQILEEGKVHEGKTQDS